MKILRHIVINYLTKHLLKAVTIEEVLQISGKEWILGRHNFSKEEMMELKEEARSFESSLLWKLMIRELKYSATLQRYDKAKTADDMIFGKSMLYAISLMEIFIKNIKQL